MSAAGFLRLLDVGGVRRDICRRVFFSRTGPNKARLASHRTRAEQGRRIAAGSDYMRAGDLVRTCIDARHSLSSNRRIRPWHIRDALAHGI